MTIPTIGELKGNTILELFKSGYNALKKALGFKQEKLIAGDNIVIDEDTNRISAIVGGTPVLEDYYTKSEINEYLSEIDGEIDTKADSTDVYEKSEVYTKTEVDNLISEVPSVDAYTKSETDALLNDKANVSSVYTKTETDNLLLSKADTSTTYTKTEVNNLVSPKANSADVYPKADVYTKSETNTLLSSKVSSSDVYMKVDTYDKTEVNNLVTPKANSSDVYTKSQVDTMINNLPVYSGIIKVVPTYTTSKVGNGYTISPNNFSIEDGDILVLNIDADSANVNCDNKGFVIPCYKNAYNNIRVAESFSANRGFPGSGLSVENNISVGGGLIFYISNNNTTEEITSFTVNQYYILRKVTE